jgi:hypothetical protein
MRMARQYWERFPFITDWSNLQGRTALHVAALKGSEDFVRVCPIGVRSVTSSPVLVTSDDLRPGSGRRPYRYTGKYCPALVSELTSIRPLC